MQYSKRPSVYIYQEKVKRQQKHAICFVTLLQNELSSDVARFTTHNLNRLPKDLQKEESSSTFKTESIHVARSSGSR